MTEAWEDQIVRRFVGTEAAASLVPTVDTDGSGRNVLRGLGIPYGSVSRVVGRLKGTPVREVIRAGAFTEVLRKQREQSVDIVSFYNHDENMILARESAGTLAVTEAEDGVRYEIALARTTYASDLAENVRVGNVAGASFMFAARSPGLVVTKQAGVYLRDVQRAAALLEIGPVVSPAYAATDCQVSARSVEQLLGVVVVPRRSTAADRVRLAVARMKANAFAR
jgi:HK97 family phage prohead protease